MHYESRAASWNNSWKKLNHREHPIYISDSFRWAISWCMRHPPAWLKCYSLEGSSTEVSVPGMPTKATATAVFCESPATPVTSSACWGARGLGRRTLCIQSLYNMAMRERPRLLDMKLLWACPEMQLQAPQELEGQESVRIGGSCWAAVTRIVNLGLHRPHISRLCSSFALHKKQ